ncbi:MAG: PQQ-binding-like beta-propeller repeat protein [Candidatus Solibacter usitatus]|nr:PQQ-binding-like beta-propeller repeat protein [Candidatus Solibacter usitatus]
MAGFGRGKATPVSDGRHVYVFFQDAGLVSYDLDGKLRWDLQLTFPQTGHGMGASPILAGDLVLMNCDLPKAGSFLVAVEKNTGRIRWRKERGETGLIAGFATPVLLGEDEIVVPGSLQWAAYSPSANRGATFGLARHVAEPPSFHSGANRDSCPRPKHWRMRMPPPERVVSARI